MASDSLPVRAASPPLEPRSLPHPAWELSGLPRDGPPQTLQEVAAAFVRRHHKTRSSMYTVESLPFSEGDRAGEVMLRYVLVR